METLLVRALYLDCPSEPSRQSSRVTPFHRRRHGGPGRRSTSANIRTQEAWLGPTLLPEPWPGQGQGGCSWGRGLRAGGGSWFPAAAACVGSCRHITSLCDMPGMVPSFPVHGSKNLPLTAPFGIHLLSASRLLGTTPQSPPSAQTRERASGG